MRVGYKEKSYAGAYWAEVRGRRFPTRRCDKGYHFFLYTSRETIRQVEGQAEA